MSHWWRAHDDAVDSPKLGLLSDRLFRAWFNLNCLASANGGKLPAIGEVAFKLRVTEHKAAEIITALVQAGLYERRDDAFEPHNWALRQFKSDVTDPNAVTRMRNYRNRKRNGTVTVTLPREQSTEAETERKEEPPDGGSSKFAFESGVIKLNRRDLDLWKASFTHLDVAAELIGMAEWASHESNWFMAVKGLLAKRNREVGIRKSQQQNGAVTDHGRGIV
jgi:hypothetical protein